MYRKIKTGASTNQSFRARKRERTRKISVTELNSRRLAVLGAVTTAAKAVVGGMLLFAYMFFTCYFS